MILLKCSTIKADVFKINLQFYSLVIIISQDFHLHDGKIVIFMYTRTR